MPVATTNELKRIFFDAYDGFVDKRVKNLDKESFFAVDGRGEGDYDARGQLFLWFCEIYVEVVDEQAVSVTLRGGVPESRAVAAWLEQHNAKQDHYGIRFSLQRGEQDELLLLAAAFRAITQPGARYEVKAYKYVCPRAAAAIEQLRRILDGAWR